MTLRQRTRLLVGITLTCLVVILYASVRTILRRSFLALEEQDTRQNVSRVLNALNDQLVTLDQKTHDWSAWDDTYEFVADRNQDYVDSNLLDEAFIALKVNTMLFIDNSGTLVFGKRVDLQSEAEAPLPNGLRGHFGASSPLLSQSATECALGILVLPDTPVLMAARPVMQSGELGVSRGTLVMANDLNAAALAHLAQTTHLSLTLQAWNVPHLPADFRAVYETLTGDDAAIAVRPLDESLVAGYTLLDDAYGNPALILRVAMPRDIYLQGRITGLYFGASLLVVGLIFGGITLLLLERTVLSRVAQLNASVERISINSDPSARLSVTGRDEVSSLGGAINGMLEALERSYTQVRDSEERYRTFVENLPLGVYRSTPYTPRRFLMANPAFLAMFGIPSEGMLLKLKVSDLYADPGRSSVFASSVIAAGSVTGVELPLRRLDGTLIWGSVNARVVQGERGEALYFDCTIENITERKQTEEQLRVRERLMACVAGVSQSLLHADAPGSVLPDALRYLGEATQSSRVCLFENHPGLHGDLLYSLRYAWNAPGMSLPAPEANLQDTSYTAAGLSRWVDLLSQGQIVAGSTVSLPAPERLALESQGVTAVLVLPLLAFDTWYGCLRFDVREGPRAWQSVEIDLLRSVADDVATAIEREQVRRQSQALAQAAAAITSTIDFNQVLDRILAQVGQVVPSNAANIMLIEGDVARVVRHQGYAAFGVEELIAAVSLRIAEVPNLFRMMDSGTSLIIPDTADYPGWVDVPATQKWLRSCAAAPIRVHEKVVGFLNADSAIPRFFNPQHAQVLQVFADYAAAAIENAHLYQEAQRRVHELTFLNRIATGLGTALDADALVGGALEGLQELVGADRTYFISVSPGGETWEVTHERARPDVAKDTGLSGAFADQPFEMAALFAGQPFVASDVANDLRVETQRELYRSLEIQSMLLVPVQARQRLYGVLGFDYCREQHTWHPDEIGLLQGVAHQLELALENVRLFEEAQLRAEELATAVTQLQQLDRLKSEFIQNVSHELRSPLSIVRGYAEILAAGEMGDLEPEQQQAVTVIARRAHMLSDLVQDITLILEAEVHPPPPAPVSLEKLVRAVIEDFQVAGVQAGLSLESQIEPDLPSACGSPAYLRRVVDNLVANAIKFTPEGGHVRVSVGRTAEQLVLRVSDTGIGIPKDQWERVFDRFYQIDGSTQRRYGGVGLGLALVKEIVEAYGGRVSLESQVGAGSTFTVYLPIIRSLQQEQTLE